MSYSEGIENSSDNKLGTLSILTGFKFLSDRCFFGDFNLDGDFKGDFGIALCLLEGDFSGDFGILLCLLLEGDFKGDGYIRFFDLLGDLGRIGDLSNNESSSSIILVCGMTGAN